MRQAEEQSPNPAVRMEGVTKQYGTVTALRQVSFSVAPGETVGLLGRNGAGKTTALSLLAGFFPPTEGTVLICGKNMMADPIGCKRHIGYLPERPPLYDEMTVTEYLRFVCDLREVASRAREAHVTEIINLCGLKDVRNRLVSQLSRGYRQRTGIAQALCGNPEVLMLDEPTAGLDPRQTAETRALIRMLGKTHSVIFSSHLLGEVQELCERVIILQEGRIAGDLRIGEQKASRIFLRVAGSREQTVRIAQSTEGVETVKTSDTERQGETSLLLRIAEGQTYEDVTDRMFLALAAHRLPIREMREEREALEEIFLRVTENREDETAS